MPIDVERTTLERNAFRSDASWGNTPPRPGFDIEPAKPSWGKLLRLPAGLYAIRIGPSRRGPQRAGENFPCASLIVPASGETGVEVLGAEHTGLVWLDATGGAAVVRVRSEFGRLIVAAFDREGELPAPPLEILKLDEGLENVGSDSFRVEVPTPRASAVNPASGAPQSRAVPDAAPGFGEEPAIGSPFTVYRGGHLKEVPIQLLLHIERAGDKRFNSERGAWAGHRGRSLRIEGLALIPRDILQGRDLEYKALDENGREGPWVPGGTFAGTRRQGRPLTGFAVRLLPSATDLYEVVYRGRFFKAGDSREVRGGDLCRSPIPGDPLSAIQVTIRPKVRR